MKFVELVDVNGVRRLLPLDKLEVHFINSDISDNNSYWVIGSTGSKEFNIHVPGPIESILEVLEGTTVSAEKIEFLGNRIKSNEIQIETRDKIIKELKGINYGLQNELKRADVIEAELKEARISYNKLEKLDPSLGQWNEDTIKRYSCPSYWSTYKYTKGQQGHTSCRLFQTPLGNIGQGFNRSLNKSDTNLRESGRLGWGGEFEIWGIKVEFFGCFEDANLLKRSGNIVFDFTQTTLDITTLGAFDWVGDSTGYYKFGEDKPPILKAKDSHSKCFVVGKNGVKLPVHTTFALSLILGADVKFKEDMEVRISLFGNLKNYEVEIST